LAVSIARLINRGLKVTNNYSSGFVRVFPRSVLLLRVWFTRVFPRSVFSYTRAFPGVSFSYVCAVKTHLLAYTDLSSRGLKVTNNYQESRREADLVER
jgi:hypothetical protein